MIEREIQTSDVVIRLSDTETGDYPLLMIHGTGASRQAFEHQLHGPLAEQYRLVAVDLPGHGRSGDAGDPDATYSIKGLADCMHQVLLSMGIQKTAVLGWSLGGHVAIELMASTKLVSGLMICGTPPVPAGPLGILRGFQLSTNTLLISKPNFTRADAEKLARSSFGDEHPQYFDDTAIRADGRLRTVVSKSMLSGGHHDQKQAVQMASVPVAIVDGALDPFVRVSYAQTLQVANLWQRVIVPEAGHAPFWQKPHIFNALLQRFLFDIQHGSSETAESQASSPNSLSALPWFRRRRA